MGAEGAETCIRIWAEEEAATKAISAPTMGAALENNFMGRSVAGGGGGINLEVDLYYL